MIILLNYIKNIKYSANVTTDSYNIAEIIRV